MARNNSSVDRDDEIDNSFYLPNNYTDSGRVFQGMFEVRNAVEAAIACTIIGYLMWSLLPFEIWPKIITMLVVLAPIGILALMGYQGDSITRTLKSIFLFLRNRRKMRYRRIMKDGDKSKQSGKRQKATNKKAKAKTKNSRTSKKERKAD